MRVSRRNGSFRDCLCEPGLGDVIIAETGGDMSRFPSAGHLASWAGTCPGSNESAGRIKFNPHSTGQSLPEGASARPRCRLRARRTPSSPRGSAASPAAPRGPMKALVALQHVCLSRSGRWRPTGSYYNDLGEDFFTRLDPDRARNRGSFSSDAWVTPSLLSHTDRRIVQNLRQRAVSASARPSSG